MLHSCLEVFCFVLQKLLVCLGPITLCHTQVLLDVQVLEEVQHYLVLPGM